MVKKTEFIESNEEGYICLTIMEKYPEFLFGSGSHYLSQYSAFCVDWSIFWGWEAWIFCRVGWLRAKLVVPSSEDAQPWFREVLCITDNVDYHITSFILEYRGRISECTV